MLPRKGKNKMKENIDDDLDAMLEYYGMVDHSEDEMTENGVSWSDFI